MKSHTSILVTIIFATLPVLAQESKFRHQPGDYIISDSASTIMIPVLYNVMIFSSNKLAVFDNYYANLVFYDFIKDSSKRLFPSDTYIATFRPNYYFDKPKNKNIAAHVILYLVHNADHNGNHKIDEHDPAILYVSDTHGNHLTALTAEDENVVNVDIFEKQNFALIKIQRDADHDGSFKAGDNDYYFRRLDLTTLTLGRGIEIK